MLWMLSVGLLLTVLGFLAGYLTFRRSLVWCPEHGTIKTCDLCRPARAFSRSHSH